MRRRLTARRGRRPALSASALAEMGVCERRVVFEQRDGRRPNAARRQAMARGRRLHARFYWMGGLPSWRAGPGMRRFVRCIRGWLGRMVRRWLLPGRRRGTGGDGGPGA